MYDQYERIVILGGPRCGKTTLANKLNRLTFHTDDFKFPHLQESGAAVVQWFARPGPWVIEGVVAILALQEWMRMYEVAPCDCVLAMWTPVVKLTPDQIRMFNLLRKYWSGLPLDLNERGVVVKQVRWRK